MDGIQNHQVIQATPRPTKELSAFNCCSQWLDVCPWPLDQREALTSIMSFAESETRRKENKIKFHESIGQRAKVLDTVVQKIVKDIQNPPQFFPVAPNLGNVVRPSIRYFRALVWNLENFTNDPRPAGTQAINSRRNQARIAIAADFAFRIGADAMLILETGNDVGQAMTRLAGRWTEKEQNSSDYPKRSVEPLVSSPTSGLPEIPLSVPARRYDAEPDKLRSLMLIGEGYSVRPDGFPSITEKVLSGALNLLIKTSNNFQKFDERPSVDGFPNKILFEWTGWCLQMLESHEFGLAEPDDIRLLRETLIDAVQSPQQFLSQPDTELGRVRETIMAARDVAAYYGSPTMEAGVAEIIQLLLISWILFKGFGTLDPKPRMKSPYARPAMFDSQPLPDILLPSQVTIWLNDFGEPADLVVLALYLGAGQPLTLSAHDPDNGAIFTAQDGELLLNGLIRLQIVPKPHAETYGVVYRPYSRDHLEAFLNAPYEELGFNTGGIYGVLHGDKTNLLVSQQTGHILAGRSALKISFPVMPDVWIPFAVHHNRFSGSKEIGVMNADYVKSENTVLARLLTLEDEARILSGHQRPSLIVGDFNLPSGFLQPEKGRKSTTEAGARRAALREKHAREMAAAGYLRRRTDYTYPETTLKRAVNIAKGRGLFSEPYDGVYQPFDFLNGQGIVRSAAVRNCGAFFPAELLNENITAASKDNAPETISIKQVLIDKIQHTYMGIVWSIIATLNDAEPWLAVNGSKNIVKNAGMGDAARSLINHRDAFGNWLKQRKYLFQSLLANNFYGTCDVVMQDNWFQFIEQKINLVKPFVQEAVKNEKKAKAQARKENKLKSGSGKVKIILQSNSGMMVDTEIPDDEYDWAVEDEEDDEDAQESSASTPTQKIRRKKPGEQRLIELGDLFKALINLEKSSDMRLWGAYTGIVSDHLPILVEVELPN